jgi:hypothetical protein
MKQKRQTTRQKAGQAPLPRVVANALRLAEDRWRRAMRLEPTLLIDGPKGVAALRLDFSTAADRERLQEKARLMATALAADACACVFESVLERPRHSPVAVVVAVTAMLDGGSIGIFLRDESGGRTVLRPADSRLAGRRLAGTLAGLLDGLLPDAPDEHASARAWRQLEEMGVNIGNGRRALH